MLTRFEDVFSWAATPIAVLFVLTAVYVGVVDNYIVSQIPFLLAAPVVWLIGIVCRYDLAGRQIQNQTATIAVLPDLADQDCPLAPK